MEQSDYISTPKAGQQGYYATSSTAATQDLRLIGPQAATTDSNVKRGTPGCQGKFIRVSCVTSDIVVAFGTTSASVGSITSSTTGTNQANTGAPIPAGTFQDFRIDSEDLFIGFVTASAAGNIHIYINSLPR